MNQTAPIQHVFQLNFPPWQVGVMIPHAVYHPHLQNQGQIHHSDAFRNLTPAYLCVWYLILQIELSDGWYAIKASTDMAFKALIESGIVCIGTKLVISGAQLQGLDHACSPLQVSIIYIPYIQKSQLAKSLAIWPVTSKLSTFILAIWNFCHYSIYES